MMILSEKERLTNTSTLLGTPTDGQSMSGTTIQPNQTALPPMRRQQRVTRRQQPIERRTREFPTLQLSNNGGIRIDFR